MNFTLGTIPAIGSIKTRGAHIAIVLFCLLLIAVVWGVTLERVRFERADAISNTNRQTANLAIAYEEQIVRVMGDVVQTLRLVKHEYAESGLKTNIRRLVDDGVIAGDFLTNIAVTDPRGNVLLSSLEYKPANVADREYFKVHQQRDTGEIFIGKPVLGRITGKWTFQVSRRINKADGSLGGVVYAAVDPYFFIRFFEQVDLGADDLVTLVNLDGTTLARHAGTTGSFGQDMRESTLLAEARKSPRGNFVSRGLLEGIPRFYSFRVLPHYPLIVAVALSRDGVLAPFRERERNYYWTASLGSALVVMAGLGFLAALARRRRAEAAHAHLAAIVESSNDAINSRTHDGIITSWNRAAERMFGYTAAEAIGQNISLIVPPEMRDDANRQRMAMTAGDLPETRDTVRCAKDGRRIDVAITRSPIRNEQGKMIGVSAILHDISARKQADKTRAQLAAIVENSNDAIIGRALDSTILSWNAAAERMFGYTAAEAIGNNLILLPPERQHESAANQQRIRQGMRVPDYDTVRVARDGRRIDVSLSVSSIRDNDGKVFCLVIILRDISERKQADKTRAQLAAIVENSNDAIIGRNLDRTILSWNAAAERLFGYTAAEAIGQSVSMLIPPDCEEDAAHSRALLAQGDAVLDHETVRLAKGGRRIDVSLSQSPIMDERGTLTSVSINFRDITERKATATSLLRTERRLRMALEDRERVSRDLHDGAVQEIYAIGLAIEEAQRLITPDPRAARARLSEQIRNLNAVMRQIREHIIDPARAELTGSQLHSELAAFADMSKSAQAPQFRVEIDAIAASRLAPRAMFHILYIAHEAMSNSLRHSGARNGLVSLTPDRDCIRLMVKDDGVGFDTGEVRGHGNGLKNIESRVREIAGQLEVHTAPGSGTRIIVDIPAGDARAA